MNKNKIYTYKEAFKILKYYERKYKTIGSKLIYDDSTIILLSNYCKTKSFKIVYYTNTSKFYTYSIGGLEFIIDDIYKINKIYNIIFVYKNDYVITKYISDLLYCNIDMYSNNPENQIDANNRNFSNLVPNISIDKKSMTIHYIDKYGELGIIKYKLDIIHKDELYHTILTLNRALVSKLLTTIKLLTGNR